MLSDSKNIAYLIATNIIDPAYEALANTYLQSFVALREELSKLIPVERTQRLLETMQASAKSFGAYLDVSRETVKNRLMEEL